MSAIIKISKESIQALFFKYLKLFNRLNQFAKNLSFLNILFKLYIFEILQLNSNKTENFKCFYASYSGFELSKFFKLLDRQVGSRKVSVFIRKLIILRYLKNNEVFYRLNQFSKSYSEQAMRPWAIKTFCMFYGSRLP